MHTITLSDDELMLLEIALEHALESLRDHPDEEETFDAVCQLLEKVQA